MYSRFGIPIISLTTLSDHLLEGVPPFIFAAPGGLYVKLDSELLKKIREEKNVSLGTLAEIAGVSRRTIQMYESGMGAMIEVAMRLEDFLNQPIVTPLDPFASQPKGKERERKEQPPANKKYHGSDVFGSEIFNILGEMGFSIVTTSKCPFEALTKDRTILILTGLGNDESRLLEKAMIVSDLSKVTERHSVIFIDTVRTKKNIRGTPIVGKDELKKINDPQDLCKLVDSRSEDDENCKC